jgi:hypothetical protein
MIARVSLGMPTRSEERNGRWPRRAFALREKGIEVEPSVTPRREETRSTTPRATDQVRSRAPSVR